MANLHWSGELDDSGIEIIKVNGVPLEPMRGYNLRVKYRDRAPRSEEV